MFPEMGISRMAVGIDSYGQSMAIKLNLFTVTAGSVSNGVDVKLGCDYTEDNFVGMGSRCLRQSGRGGHRLRIPTPPGRPR